VHHRRRRADGLNPFAGRNLAEVAVDERQRRVGIDVAGQRDRGVRRMVIAAEERLHFLEPCGLEVGHFADRRPVIRMVRWKQRREHRHRRQAVWTVLVVLAALVQDDVALVAEFRVGQRGKQVSHAIRLHPERELQCVGRHDFPVIGAIRVGRSVERRAGALQGLKVTVVVVLRPFEHEVLEQMRKARVARTLVLRPDVVPDVDRDDRTRVVFVQQHVESIRERVLAVGQRHRKLPQVGMSLP
jgi:hypothetical protein